MKKMMVIALAILMLVSLAACRRADSRNQGDSAPNGEAGSNSQIGSSSDTNHPLSPAPEGASLTGKLNYIHRDDRDPSVLKGVTIYGNRAGSAELNSRAPAAEGVRNVFELNEHVGFVPDTDAEDGMEVWVFRHRDNQQSYETAEFSEQMPGFVNSSELSFDKDEPENSKLGEFYLDPEDWDAGYYDFVFVYDGKAVATLLTRFYNMDELEGKSDDDLEALMRGRTI